MTRLEKKYEAMKQKAIAKYNDWVEHNMICDSWIDDSDEDDVVECYENINGDFVWLKRDDNGNIIEAGEN